MSYTQARAEDCVGKTVAGTVSGFRAGLLVVFTDETFMAYAAQQEYDDIEVIETEAANLLDFPAAVLDQMGVLTEAEREAVVEEARQSGEAARRESELRTLEWLKRKYESDW